MVVLIEGVSEHAAVVEWLKLGFVLIDGAVCAEVELRQFSFWHDSGVDLRDDRQKASIDE